MDSISIIINEASRDSFSFVELWTINIHSICIDGREGAYIVRSHITGEELAAT